ncbi:aromatic amino acid lyase [Adhaeribacter aquaticus]|uniref:aromatic amino acid lyase n=1 Tax=Adhaeribacter aquaticus TaxID=299567 RepID=UPI000413C050|nr:aromatic amino acid lyase [Adhaeribacter aquaticus]
MALAITNRQLTLANLTSVVKEKPLLELDADSLTRKQEEPQADKQVQTAVAEAYLEAHVIGFEAELPEDIIRLALTLQIYLLGKTPDSPVPDSILNRLLAFYNREVFPIVLKPAPEASLLAQLAAPLLGKGKVRFQSYELNAADVLEMFSWDPLPLSPAEVQMFVRTKSFRFTFLAHSLIQLKPYLNWYTYLSKVFEQIASPVEGKNKGASELTTAFEALQEAVEAELAAPDQSKNLESLLNHFLVTLSESVNLIASYTAETFTNLMATSEPPALSSFSLAHELTIFLQQQVTSISLTQQNMPVLNEQFNILVKLTEQVMALGFWSVTQVGKVFNLAEGNLTLGTYYHSSLYVPKETVKDQLVKVQTFITNTTPIALT